MRNQAKLGLGSAVSTGVGLIVATSCLMTLGQGSGALGVAFILPMVVACALNMMTAASLCELSALMPNLTGGLAQYTLAGLGPFPTIVSMVGGYLFCNSMPASVEAAMLGLAVVEITGLPISPTLVGIAVTIALIIASLNGIDVFAKIQNTVAGLLIGSMAVMGLIGAFGLGTGVKVEQPLSVTGDLGAILPLTAMAFWLFIGVEFIVPIATDMKNPRKHVPISMFLSLGIICVLQIVMVLGFHNYTQWGDLAASNAPHILYGMNMLGEFGKIWMGVVAVLATVSTLNSVLNSLAKICYGMAKINILPGLFQKTNKKGAPVWGVLIFGGAICAIQATGLTTADEIMFLILTGSIFWMISYVLMHINVLVLRRRLPNAPRSFRVPLVFNVLGIGGAVYMLLNIAPDIETSRRIWILAGVAFAVLSVYAVAWIKLHMKVPVFKSMSLEKVMATENEFYYITHIQRPRERKQQARAEARRLRKENRAQSR
ncbi:MAG: APC family permease [Oscillospiraceae bacterium]|nr:APC family permease [Oscillospiraceae bacterium]